MNVEKPHRPPPGGADLECLLSCRRLARDSATAVLDVCGQAGFELAHPVGVLVYGRDHIEPLDLLSPEEFSRFEAGSMPSVSRSIFRLVGRLSSEAVDLSIILDWEESVVSIGTIEDVLWSFSPPYEVSLAVMLEFGALCRSIAQRIDAAAAAIGTESLQREEMNWERIGGTALAQDPERALGEDALVELVRWYEEVYVRRWDR